MLGTFEIAWECYFQDFLPILPKYTHHLSPMDENDKITASQEDLDDEVLPDWGIINKAPGRVYIDTQTELIPRRSDKYFDPDGSNTQNAKLEESRRQMYLALLSVRCHHMKLFLAAVWIPAQKMALVPHAKGNFFKDIGVAHNFKNKKKLQGMWLTPVETVYLTERGSMVTYLADENFMNFVDSNDVEFEYLSLTQLSMAHLYGLALGSEPDLIDKYQVYALLKRSGYMIMEFRQHFNQYDSWNELHLKLEPAHQSLWSKVTGWFASLGLYSRSLSKSFYQKSSHYLNYTLVFESLQILNSYSAFESLWLPPLPDKRYEITYNVWKPNQAFSKKNPPMPDFQVCVLNIERVPFPPLDAIKSMWNQLNFSFAAHKIPEPAPKKTSNKQQQLSKKQMQLQRKKERESKLDSRIIERNKYLKLRDSKLKSGVSGRSIILATIDNGIINFNALNETEFKLTTKLCVRDLDEITPKTSHGMMWNPPIKL